MISGHKQSKSPIVVCVEGIISAGKSCLISCLVEEWLKRGIRVRIIQEPVGKWGDILPLFCEDPSRWGYHFQTKAFHDRVQEAINAWEKYSESTDIFLMERSVFSDTLFMKALFEQNLITLMEMEHYTEWWKLWVRVVPFAPTLFIYLTPTIEEAMRRKVLRNRPGEEKITSEYQLMLKKYHDSLFDKEVIHEGSSIPVMRIDSNVDYKNDVTIKEELATDILVYISNTCNC